MKCGQKCEVYSRVVGYHNPVQHWNKGKKEEFKQRIEFQESVSMNSPILDGNKVVQEITNDGTTTSSVISNYLLFTFPHCNKCDEVKDYLGTTNFKGEAVNLKDSEGYKAFQGYYKEVRDKLKRDDDNSVLLPVMLAFNESNEIVDIAQTLDEVKGLA